MPRTKANIVKAKSKLKKGKNKKKEPNGKDISLREPAGEWQIIYGLMRVGGTYTFAHNSSDNKYLYQVVTIAAHEVQAIDKVFLDNEEVTFGALPGLATGKFNGKVYRQDNLGSAAQSALSSLITDVPSLWTSDHKQSNRAHIYLRFQYDKELFPNGLPDVSFEVRGKKLYDSRTTLTGYSTNAALALLDYLIDTQYGLGIPIAEIDTASFNTAADVCDEAVSLLAGGTEARYTVNGVIYSGESPRNVIEKLLGAMAGKLLFVGGKWKVLAGKYYAPTITLTDSDLLSEITVSTRVSRRDNFNAVRGTYVSPQNNWEESDFPAIQNSFYKGQDNNEQVWEDISLPLTTSPSTAQRLAKIELERVRQPMQVQLMATLKAYQVEPGDNVNLTIARFGWSVKAFEVLDMALATDNDDNGVPMFGVNLNLKETSSAIYDWNNGNETNVDTAPNTSLPNPFTVTTPTGLTLASGTAHLYVKTDGTVVSRIKASWTQTTDFYVLNGGRIELQYKKSADVDWASATPTPGDSSFNYVTDVQDGVQYDVQIRAVSALGVTSSYITVTGHTVVGKTEPPSDVTGLTAQVGSFGIALYWNENLDPDLGEYLVRLGDTNQSWVDSELIAEIKTTSYSLPIKVSGDYRFQVKARDTSSNESITPAVIDVTIGKPSQPAPAATIAGDSVVLTWADSTGFFSVEEYEISFGTDYGTSIAVASVKSTSFAKKVSFGGLGRFWVAARDVAGNLSNPGYVDVTVLAPTAVQTLTVDVVDNNVLLKWVAPATNTLPIDHYKVYKGNTFAGATLVGLVGGTFAALFEQVAGTFVYWVVPFDTAANQGATNSIQAIVNQPPDFIIYNDQEIDLTTATLTSAVADNASLATLPINLTETWADHFSTNGWSTPQDQIDDGYPIYIQPAASYGVIEKIIDYGTTIPGTLVKLTYVSTILDGAPIINPSIGYGTDGVNFTISENVTQIYAQNFRYVKVRIVVGKIIPGAGEPLGLLLALTQSGIAPDLESLVQINNVHVRLDLKQIKDDGAGVSSVTAPVTVTFTKTFLDINSIVVQPLASLNGSAVAPTPAIPVVDFQDDTTPTDFKVYIFDQNGNQIARDFKWHAEGV